MEKLDKIDVGRVGAEVLLEKGVNGGFKHESVVDSYHANTLLAVPTGLATAGNTRIHDVVGNEKEGLEKLRHPAKRSSLEILLFGKRLLEEEGDRVRDGHAAVAFSTERVDFERLRSSVSVQIGTRYILMNSFHSILTLLYQSSCS